MNTTHDILWTCMNVIELVKRNGINIFFDIILKTPMTEEEIDFLHTELTKLCQNTQIELDFLHLHPLLSLRFLIKASE